MCILKRKSVECCWNKVSESVFVLYSHKPESALTGMSKGF